MQYIVSSIVRLNGSSNHELLGLGTLTMIIYNLHLFEKDIYAWSKKENKIKSLIIDMNMNKNILKGIVVRRRGHVKK